MLIDVSKGTQSLKETPEVVWIRKRYKLHGRDRTNLCDKALNN